MPLGADVGCSGLAPTGEGRRWVSSSLVAVSLDAGGVGETEDGVEISAVASNKSSRSSDTSSSESTLTLGAVVVLALIARSRRSRSSSADLLIVRMSPP